MASPTYGNMKSPFSYHGGKDSNPKKFIQEFVEFSNAMNWNEFQTRISFKLSLHGKARIWIESLEPGLNFNILEKMFLKRFMPLNNVTICINELVAAKRGKEETLLGFLDRLKGIACKGSLPHDVLVAMALKALPVEFTNRLIVAQGGVTWDTLYESCSIWVSTGLETKEVDYECYSGRYSRKGRWDDVNEIRRNGRNSKCFYCEKEGHRIKDCFAFKNFKNKQKEKKEVFSIRGKNEKENTNPEELNKQAYDYFVCSLNFIKDFETKIYLADQCVNAIYDTGSDLSLIDVKFAGNLNVVKSNKRILAANNKFLKVCGETEEVYIKVDNFKR
ncbi:hypothetical protein H311_04412, partial [Anncaliia algerae PRA109]